MTDITIKRLEFARGEGEALATGRVRLDANGPEYNIFLLWMPQQASWVLDMSTTDGRVIVNGAWVRDRVHSLGTSFSAGSVIVFADSSRLTRPGRRGCKSAPWTQASRPSAWTTPTSMPLGATIAQTEASPVASRRLARLHCFGPEGTHGADLDSHGG